MKNMQKVAYVSSTSTTKMQEVPSMGPHQFTPMAQARKCIHKEFFLDFFYENSSQWTPRVRVNGPPPSKEETWPPLPMPPPPSQKKKYGPGH